MDRPVPPRASHPRLAYGLIATGLLVIVVAVLFVLETANGPGAGPRSFAQRRGYDQVKVEVHRVFPFALLGALGGLALALYGGRLLRSSEERP
jgi:hypothetical protein